MIRDDAFTYMFPGLPPLDIHHLKIKLGGAGSAQPGMPGTLI